MCSICGGLKAERGKWKLLFAISMKQNDVMWSVKWLAAFFCIANIKCSMIVGNYRVPLSTSVYVRACASNWNVCSLLKSHKIDVFRLHSLSLSPTYPFSPMCVYIYIMCAVPETKSPYDITWHELSSPYTESNTENVSETTLAHEPFFDEPSAQVNVTTQLGSDVILHCRVNDLRERMVCAALIILL